MATTYEPPTSAHPAPDTRWRTRDITITAVIGVAFGVVFWAWGLVWELLTPLAAARDLFYAVWLMPAVLAPLIVRKPGAAIFAEMVAAGVSALIGSQWGVTTLLSGFVQGAGAELVFAFTLYRRWTLPVVGLAAIAAAAGAWVLDWALWYPEVALEVQLVRGLLMGVSAAIIVAVGSWYLAKGLRTAGVLEGFPD